MKSNLSTADRFFRLMIAATIATLFFSNTVSGNTGLFLIVAAGVLFATTLMAFCPLYALFGISTCKVKRKDAIV